MKLSTRARYSVRLMIYLADHARPDKPVSLGEVAREQGLSVRYLEQLVVPLRHASLVKSSTGKGGGYFLTREPKDIRIGEIIEVSIGPIKLMDCLEPEYSCRFIGKCNARRMWGIINARITDVLHDYSLEDLSEGGVSEEGSEKEVVGES